MGRFDIRSKLRRKHPSGTAEKSREETPYVPSPSALRYPGVKAEPKAEPAPKPAVAEDAKKDESGLPRCPKCGWSVGFTDSKCSNCGQLISRRR